MSEKIKEHTYYVRGMHCASCEVLIEKKLLESGSIKSVEASMAKGEALIEYEGKRPTPKRLNEIFKREGYVFSDLPRQSEAKAGQPREFFIIFCIGLLIIIGFIGLNKLGLSGLINVGSKSSLLMFFCVWAYSRNFQLCGLGWRNNSFYVKTMGRIVFGCRLYLEENSAPPNF